MALNDLVMLSNEGEIWHALFFGNCEKNMQFLAGNSLVIASPRVNVVFSEPLLCLLAPKLSFRWNLDSSPYPPWIQISSPPANAAVPRILLLVCLPENCNIVASWRWLWRDRNPNLCRFVIHNTSGSAGLHGVWRLGSIVWYILPKGETWSC